MEETKSNQKNIGIMILVAVIIAAGSFYGGTLYAGTQKTAGGANQRNGAGFAGGARPGGGANRSGAGFVTGSIIKSDATTITVKMRDGSSKIIYLSDATTVGKTVAGTKSDLAIGDNVMVNGKANADGSVVADNVAIRPVDVPGMPSGGLNAPVAPGATGTQNPANPQIAPGVK